MTMRPYMSPAQGHRIRTGGASVAIPRRASHAGGSLCDQQRRRPRDDRLQAQQGRCRAGHGTSMPRARRFPPERCSGVRTRHCPGPATDTPGQPRRGGLLERRRPPGLGVDIRLGLAHQPPADRDRRRARVVPHGGVRGDRDLPGPCARPRLHAPRGPWGPGRRPHGRQRRPTRAVEPGPAGGLRWMWGRGIIEGRVETPTRDHTGTGPRLDLVQPLQSRHTAVGHHGALTPRQPAPHEADHRPSARRHGWMVAATRLREARGGAQDRQTGPRPDAGGPG